MKELTVEDAIQRINYFSNLEGERYSIRDYSPNTLQDMVYDFIYDSEVGTMIKITYYDSRKQRSVLTCIKMSEGRWEDEGYLHNRAKGSMSGPYSTENEMYKSLQYILDYHDCTKLNIIY